jgi:ribosomal-protein-alanine N-acetyltransferase
MKNPYIIGNKTYLRALERSDLTGNLYQWANDFNVNYFMFMGTFPNTLERVWEEYEPLLKSKNDVVMAVIDRQADTHIGNVGLYSINWISRSAEYRIVIGEKRYWGKGYGTEATKLTIAYGFEKLNLNKIWLGVNQQNLGAVKTYTNSGFVYEGLLRQEIYRNGWYYNAIRMSILREEYLC